MECNPIPATRAPGSEALRDRNLSKQVRITRVLGSTKPVS
jgi:hypothetical protein